MLFLRRVLPLLVIGLAATPALAVELVTLDAKSWDRYAPAGKEVDCIYGDLVLRNDKIVAVIAKPVAKRNANMTVRNAGGCIIDLTRTADQNDQLSGFYPGGKAMNWRRLSVEADGKPADTKDGRIEGRTIVVRVQADTTADEPQAEVRYTLADGANSISIETVLTNATKQPLRIELLDDIRADKSFEKGHESRTSLYWAYDKWWGQAYGVMRDPAVSDAMFDVDPTGVRLRYTDDGKKSSTLAPGETRRLNRYLFSAANELGLRAIASQLRGISQHDAQLTVVDTAGKPVAAADVEVRQADEVYGRGRTDEHGQLAFQLPAGQFEAAVTEPAHGSQTVKLRGAQQKVTLPEAGVVVATIRNEQGGPIPAKVQFRGQGGTPDPYFFHNTGEHAVQNLYYTHNGSFRQKLPPGQYQAIISYGPEYDAVFTNLEVRRGQETPLVATLVHSVQTPGWISADFHSHSTPSGDNTSSQLGRVLNLLCEHIEYAPCTEHNRLSTYEPHLERLGVRKLMGTSVGIELTDSPLPLNHHNAFPLIPHDHEQDNGAPESDLDVELKVERLALWDHGSDKLVQQNHPNIGNLFYDRNGDGRPDGGFSKVFPYLDCIEVHPLNTILDRPDPKTMANSRRGNNRIFNWLQLINDGHRIPGVVNTDAHYNFHGSGHLRIYVKSPTDDPSKIKTLDIVHAVEHGNVVMTTGPYLEVSAESSSSGAGKPASPGDNLTATDGKVQLAIRVQCPNWFDIDRVQVLVSGREDEKLNFTREKTPERFRGGWVKFDAQIPLELKSDTHLIVIAAGQRSTLGPVFGPTYGKNMPIAVSNPIYVDIAGDGFQPNHDTLGVPLPVISPAAAK